MTDVLGGCNEKRGIDGKQLEESGRSGGAGVVQEVRQAGRGGKPHPPARIRGRTRSADVLGGYAALARFGAAMQGARPRLPSQGAAHI